MFTNKKYSFRRVTNQLAFMILYKKRKVRKINFADFPTLTQTLQNYTMELIAV